MTGTEPGGRSGSWAGARAAVAASVVVLLAACDSSVAVAPLSASEDPRCTAAGDEWPETVLGLSRRDTDPARAWAGAWGDPAIVARCGAPSPPPTQDPCITVNGVDWVMSDLSDGKRFVTYGREPAIEVLVPRAHAPEPEALPRFAAAASKLTRTGRHCR